MKFHYPLIIFSMVLFQQSLNAAEYDAKLTWDDVRQLSLPVSGVIEKINVAAGSYVEAGEKMLSLDCGLYTAQLKQSRAIVNGLKPGVETALKEKELADELFARTVLSEVEHRHAELVYIEKQSSHDAAQAHSEQMLWQVKHCDLVADRQLMVLDVHLSAGQLFSLKTDKPVLLTVASKKTMQVTAQLPLPLKKAIKVNQPVKVRLDGQIVDAKVSSINYPSANAAIVSVRFNMSAQQLMSAKAAKLIIE
ncbi:MAG: efflux RND transporter periplasmic adaptor subunit [Gammaproteobacteria bacterium]|nr:efflux RND transporter periplasmic adaptor subunit [Gammaproteobacteria bacterium]